MVHLCLGWKLDSILEQISFPTEDTYSRPKPSGDDDIVGEWWKDLFSYLGEFEAVNAFACSGSMDFFGDDDVFFIGIAVESGWVLTYPASDSVGFYESSKIQDFQDLLDFIHDQNLKGSTLPSPKIHISEWEEHDFIPIEIQVDSIIEYREEKKMKAKRWAERRSENLCDIYPCENKYSNSIRCEYCHGHYCDEHQQSNLCYCGVEKLS